MFKIDRKTRQINIKDLKFILHNIHGYMNSEHLNSLKILYTVNIPAKQTGKMTRNLKGKVHLLKKMYLIT